MEVCNFADETTFFACDKDLGSLVNILEHDSFLAIGGFKTTTLNWMKISGIYLLEGTNMKVSGQELVMQEFGSLLNKSYWGYI